MHIKKGEGGKNNKYVQPHMRFFPRNPNTTILWEQAPGSVIAFEYIREEEGLLDAWKTD